MKYFFILFFNINVFAQQAVFLPATEIQRQYYIETNTWFDGSPMNNEKVDYCGRHQTKRIKWYKNHGVFKSG